MHDVHKFSHNSMHDIHRLPRENQLEGTSSFRRRVSGAEGVVVKGISGVGGIP